MDGADDCIGTSTRSHLS